MFRTAGTMLIAKIPVYFEACWQSNVNSALRKSRVSDARDLFDCSYNEGRKGELLAQA